VTSTAELRGGTTGLPLERRGGVGRQWKGANRVTVDPQGLDLVRRDRDAPVVGERAVAQRAEAHRDRHAAEGVVGDLVPGEDLQRVEARLAADAHQDDGLEPAEPGGGLRLGDEAGSGEGPATPVRPRKPSAGMPCGGGPPARMSAMGMTALAAGTRRPRRVASETAWAGVARATRAVTSSAAHRSERRAVGGGETVGS
jgi:hypothetical protein